MPLLTPLIWLATLLRWSLAQAVDGASHTRAAIVGFPSYLGELLVIERNNLNGLLAYLLYLIVQCDAIIANFQENTEDKLADASYYFRVTLPTDFHDTFGDLLGDVTREQWNSFFSTILVLGIIVAIRRACMHLSEAAVTHSPTPPATEGSPAKAKEIPPTPYYSTAAPLKPMFFQHFQGDVEYFKRARVYYPPTHNLPSRLSFLPHPSSTLTGRVTRQTVALVSSAMNGPGGAQPVRASSGQQQTAVEHLRTPQKKPEVTPPQADNLPGPSSETPFDRAVRMLGGIPNTPQPLMPSNSIIHQQNVAPQFIQPPPSQPLPTLFPEPNPAIQPSASVALDTGFSNPDPTGFTPVVSQTPQFNFSSPKPLPPQATSTFQFDDQSSTHRASTSRQSRVARRNNNRRTQPARGAISQVPTPSQQQQQQHMELSMASHSQPIFGQPPFFSTPATITSSTSATNPNHSNISTSAPHTETTSVAPQNTPTAPTDDSTTSTATPGPSNTSSVKVSVRPLTGENFESDVHWTAMDAARFKGLKRHTFGWAHDDATNEKIWTFSTGESLKMVSSEPRWSNSNNVGAELHRHLGAFKRAIFMLRLQSGLKPPTSYTSRATPLLDEVYNFIKSAIDMTKACGGKGKGPGWDASVEWSSQFHFDVYDDKIVADKLRTNYGLDKWAPLEDLWRGSHYIWLDADDDLAEMVQITDQTVS